jgi:hypothetical protein
MVYPTNWRSPYVLVKNKVGAASSIEDITEEQLEAALDGINAEAIEATVQMAQEIDSLKKEIASLKERPAPLVTVNVAQPAKPGLEDMGFFEVLLFLIKKLLRFFGGRP